MLDIEIINATLLSGGNNRESSKGIGAPDTFCAIRLFSKEIGRTTVCYNSYEPVWHAKFERSYEDLATLERIHHRPCFLEYFDIEVYEVLKTNAEKFTKIYETRIHLTNTGSFKGYKLLKTTGYEAKGELSMFEYARIFVRINRNLTTEIYKSIPSFGFAQLCDVCPQSSPYYRHLYLDFDWSPLTLTYHFALPGPLSGEMLIDKYDLVEWRTPCITNSFGDRLYGVVKGTLLITDLRVIFLPVHVSLPYSPPLDLLLTDQSCFVKSDLLVHMHKYTIQLPLSSLADCRSSSYGAMSSSPNPASSPSSSYMSANSTPAHVLNLKTLHEQTYEFVVCKPSYGSSYLQLPHTQNSELYVKGLHTSRVDPSVWCSRVQDYILYEIRCDSVWLRWAKYLKKTCAHFATPSDRLWLKRIRGGLNLDSEYKRMYVQDLNWRLSTLNSTYNLCPTYPSVLVFPGYLNEDDIIQAASQRSIGRLPALVWLHPETKAPLCRAAQPMAGLSGSGIEFDKKILLAIKASCPAAHLPLRIADARPKLNANANAMAGKGFENVSFMGGSSVVSLVFMDIDNIHVMRGSLARIKEGFGCHSDSSGSGGASGSGGSGGGIEASRWLNHLAGLLKGACGIADSLCMGHSMLVHCSDGWDRTSQLTTLSQILLDPYYRTIDGLLALLHKDWMAFGHKFEERLNRIPNMPKEASPVFLQVLDCIAQVMKQFPNAFEYTEHLLQVIVYAFQSGFMTSFRGNNERERYMMMRHGSLFEDTVTEDFDFSTLSLYIHLLLRTYNYSSLLLNSTYTPPNAYDKKVLYIRPRYGVQDMVYWREGLFGMNHNIFDATHLSAPVVDAKEAQVMAADMLARHLSFMDVHGRVNAIPETAILHEVVRSPVYPVNTYQPYAPTPSAKSPQSHTLSTSLYTPYAYTHHKYFAHTSSLYVQDAFMVDRKFHVCHSNIASMFLHRRLGAVLANYDDIGVAKAAGRSSEGLSGQGSVDKEGDGMTASDEDEEDDFMGREGADTLTHCVETLQQSLANIQTRRLAYREHASVIIQNFFKAYVSTRLALVVYKVVSVDECSLKSWGQGWSKKQKKRVGGLYRALNTLVLSYIKHRQTLREGVYYSRKVFMQSIVEDMVMKAVDTAERERLANQLAANMQLAMKMLEGVAAGGDGGMGSGMGVGGVGSGYIDSPSHNSPKKTFSSRIISSMMGSSNKDDARSVSPVPRSRTAETNNRGSVDARPSVVEQTSGSDAGLARVSTLTGVDEEIIGGSGEGASSSGKGGLSIRRMMGGLLGGGGKNV